MALARTTEPPLHVPDTGLRGWLLELSIGALVIALGLAAWAYTHFSAAAPRQDRPKPAWLGVSKVMAQMGDGRMVTLKVGLRLRKEGDAGELQPHMPAFQSLIQETGATISQEDLQSPAGVRRFGQAIRESLNHYLDERNMPERIQDVAFEELLLMP